MRMRHPNLGLALCLVAAFSGAVGLAGCGSGAGDRAGDSSGGPSDLPVHVASVDVTYYYLPG